MIRISSVLCPIDFTSLAHRELDVAIEVCRAFDAKLILHHNFVSASPVLGRVWEWGKEHAAQLDAEPAGEERLRKWVDRVGDRARVEGRITHGPLAWVVPIVAEQEEADLLVLGSHGPTDEEHESITERILRRSPCPVLAFDEASSGTETFHLLGSGGERPRGMVATDFSASGTHAVRYALDLARRLDLELHLVHVLHHPWLLRGPVEDDGLPRVPGQSASEADAQWLEEMVPEDLRGRVHCHVERGRPAAELVEAARRIEPSFLILGEHARGFFRGLLTRNTVCQVLHGSPCAVWYVPFDAWQEVPDEQPARTEAAVSSPA